MCVAPLDTVRCPTVCSRNLKTPLQENKGPGPPRGALGLGDPVVGLLHPRGPEREGAQHMAARGFLLFGVTLGVRTVHGELGRQQ